LAPPGIPKMSVTPSALRLCINASAALMERAMLAAGLCAASRGFQRVPARPRVDRALDHAVPVALEHAQHGLDQLLPEQGRLEAEIQQLGVGRVVVMLFEL